jgi:hypothetical protein
MNNLALIFGTYRAGTTTTIPTSASTNTTSRTRPWRSGSRAQWPRS